MPDDAPDLAAARERFPDLWPLWDAIREGDIWSVTVRGLPVAVEGSDITVAINEAIYLR
jgi:hypothetical protein